MMVMMVVSDDGYVASRSKEVDWVERTFILGKPPVSRSLHLRNPQHKGLAHKKGNPITITLKLRAWQRNKNQLSSKKTSKPVRHTCHGKNEVSPKKVKLNGGLRYACHSIFLLRFKKNTLVLINLIYQ